MLLVDGILIIVNSESEEPKIPNWCDNSVRLTHQDKEKIDALENVLKDQQDCEVFYHLRPRPVEEDENWYDWNCNNWGTKWDMTIIDFNREDDHTVWVSFETAWSPPIALYEFLTEEGWEVEGYYHESGCAFCGKYTNEDGDEFYEYDFRDRESIEALPQDIEEFTGLLDYHDSCKEDGYFDEEEVD